MNSLRQSAVDLSNCRAFEVPYQANLSVSCLPAACRPIHKLTSYANVEALMSLVLDVWPDVARQTMTRPRLIRALKFTKG